MNPTDTPTSPRDDNTMPGVKTDQDPSKQDEIKDAPKTNPGDDESDDEGSPQ